MTILALFFLVLSKVFVRHDYMLLPLLCKKKEIHLGEKSGPGLKELELAKKTNVILIEIIPINWS